MRKIHILLLSVLALALHACDDSTREAGEIIEADLTERENAILSTTAEHSFVFDFDIEEEHEELTLSVEKYESEALVDEQLIFHTSEIQEEGSIIFAVSGMNYPQNQMSIHSGISSSNTVAASHNEMTLPDEDFSAIWGSNPNEMDPSEGEIVLASINYFSANGGVSTPSAQFYTDVDEHIDELSKYDVTFLLKAKFE